MNQIARKSITAPNFMRSAMAPMMRAGVIAAKVSWKMTKQSSGKNTPAVNDSMMKSIFTGPRNILLRSPMNGLSAEGVAGPAKASE